MLVNDFYLLLCDLFVKLLVRKVYDIILNFKADEKQFTF